MDRITDLPGLSTRAKNCLTNSGLTHVDLFVLSDSDLLRIPGVGANTAKNIRESLKAQDPDLTGTRSNPYQLSYSPQELFWLRRNFPHCNSPIGVAVKTKLDRLATQIAQLILTTDQDLDVAQLDIPLDRTVPDAFARKKPASTPHSAQVAI